jgi:hypothetical protein
MSYIYRTHGLLPVESDRNLKQVKNNSTNPDTTRKLGTNQCRKAQAFAEYLSDVFQPHLPESEPEVEETLIQLLEAPYQLESSFNRLTSAAVQEVITSLNPKKASG